MAENELVASALQCWNSIQMNYGVNACTMMSMMSEKLLPSACEVDVTGWRPCMPCSLLRAPPARWWTGTIITPTIQ